jgi:hypothetical protein
MLQLLRKLDLMRIVLGICMVVDGMPLVFFLKETLKLAPGSQAFTAVFLGMGFVFCVPFTVFRRLYRPNELLFWMSIAFIGLCIFYMYYGNPYPSATAYTTDLVYFIFSLLFLFLLINIPNDIIEVAVPVIIAFTVISNLALVYALMTDPTWNIGQRAAINFSATNGERMGNPHAFARNAFMGVVACGVWAFRPQTGIIARTLSLFAAVFSAGILVLTQTRSSIVALGAVVILFLLFNVRPAQVKSAIRGLLSPVPIITIAIFFFGLSFILQKYSDIYDILYGYAVAFIDRNMENVYAALGLKSSGAAYKAALDASAANRTVSAGFFSNVIVGHMEMLFLGNGYKFLYLDIPIMEAFVNHGLPGLILFGGLNALIFYYSLRAMQTNHNTLTTFLAYFYLFILVQMFTNGRPYEISHWHPLGLMIRFMGIDNLIPVRLWNHPPAVTYDGYAVPPTAPSRPVINATA